MLQVREENILDNLLETNAEFLRQVLGVTHCFILPQNPENNAKIYHSGKKNQDENILISQLGDIFDYYYSQLLQEKLIIFSETDQELSPIVRNINRKYQFKSLMIVPLMDQQFYLGTIYICNEKPKNEWRKDELNIILNTARHCSMVLYEEQIQQKKQQEDLLHQINTTLNSKLDALASLEQILRQIGEYFQVDRVITFQIHKNRTEVYCCWQINENLPAIINSNIWELQSQLQELKEKYQKRRNNFVGEIKTIKTEETHLKYLVSVPIFVREKFFGCLTLQILDHNFLLNEREKETIEKITEQIALAIDRIAREKEKINLLASIKEEKKRNIKDDIAKKEYFDRSIHDLRAPLSAILGFSRMLKEEIYGSLNLKQMQYASGIFTSGEHMLQLVNNLLDLSKIEANKEELDLERVPVEEICKASTCMVEERAKEQGLELILNIEETLDFCVGDKLRLKQILVNLLTNAIKFTEKGSITLKVRSKENMIEFSVIDTGIGIKKADQEKLFQPFAQIYSHLTRRCKGTGLGLVLSRNLARLHGGDLTISSEEGKGSCFTLHLPIKDYNYYA